MKLWSQAKALAAQTPGDRNRYVDFLRAVSILVVVTGHWLIAGFYYADATLKSNEILVIQPQTQWLTWVFQVMPIFFIVGGYSNAASQAKARAQDLAYANWLASRLNRLVTPLLALLLGWGALAGLLQLADVSGEVVRLASRTALIPLWFLAIYIMLVVLAPASYAAWRRWGFASFWAFVLAGAVVDTAFFVLDFRLAGWSNYFWVWLAVHQLGYAWRDGRLGSPARLLAYAVLAFGLLVLLVTRGPYPLAMVGSPDEDLSNSLPPKITLVVLGVMQLGLLLSIEGPMRRILLAERVWAATVLINSMIMTLYLWHLTVMVGVVAVAYLAGGVGLGPQPGDADWWLTRPLWIVCLYALLLPAALLLSPLERRTRGADAPAPPASRQVVGAILICGGVGLLGRFGFGSTPIPGLDAAAFLLVLIGAAISGLLPGFR